LRSTTSHWCVIPRMRSVTRTAYDLAAEEGLKLIWFAGRRSKASLPRAAVVRWFRADGKSDAASFASEPMPFPLATESRLAGAFPTAGCFARPSSPRER
jgi:hypothetical protein